VITGAIDLDQTARLSGSDNKPLIRWGPESMSRTSNVFLAALRKAKHHRQPFDCWRLEDILPDAVSDAIAALPFPPVEDAIFDGRRESNNPKRVYFHATDPAALCCLS